MGDVVATRSQSSSPSVPSFFSNLVQDHFYAWKKMIKTEETRRRDKVEG